MKKLLIIFVLTFSVNGWALVQSSQCPEQFTATFKNINKVELNPAIEENFFVKTAWERMQPKKEVTQLFKILTRTESALCVYVGGGKAVYLQTNNFQDELVIPYDQDQTTYFRLNVSSFSPKHLELESTTALNLFAPILFIDSDGGTYQLGDEKVGIAESVNIHL